MDSKNLSDGDLERIFPRADKITTKPIEWLWPGRIQSATITVVEGDPGAAKSTLMADIASRVTVGREMPGSDFAPEAAGVVCRSAERWCDMEIGNELRPTGSNESDFDAALDRIRELVGGDPLREWERRFGEPPPRSIDDLVRWAIRVGWDGEYVRNGDWNPIELMPFIEGHLQRLRDQPQVGSGARSSTPPADDAGRTDESGEVRISDNFAPFSIRLLGDDWNIRYDGGPLFALPCLIGLGYIHHLIEEQGQVYSALELRGAVQQHKSEPAGRDQIAAKQSGEDGGTGPSYATNAGQTLGLEEMKDIFDRLEEIEVDYDEAKEECDEARILKLEDEREEILAWMADNTFRGKAKLLQDDNARAQKAVKKAIKEAIDRIEQKDAKCAQHLRNTIRTTREFEYRPDRKIVWET